MLLSLTVHADKIGVAGDAPIIRISSGEITGRTSPCYHQDGAISEIAALNDRLNQ